MPDLQTSKKYLLCKKQLFDQYYEKLNDKQREAVYQINGPLLILAGAGSGKTTVLVNRLAYMIRYGNAYHDETVPQNAASLLTEMEAAKSLDHDALGEFLIRFKVDAPPAWSVMAITFTNKAAREIKERIIRIFGEDSAEASDIMSGTFHSICVQLLRRYGSQIGRDRNFTICDTDDVKKQIGLCMKQLNIDDKILPVKTVMNTISRAKDKLIAPTEFAMQAGQDVKKKQIAAIYELYQGKLRTQNLLDFDDIIMETVRLLTECEDVRATLQNRYRYVCVDEYQDTNYAQLELTLLLSGKYRNIMVVGDDDQSIYKFRGAVIENILNFDKNYDNTAVIKLEENYRSTKTILNAANSVIAHNNGRLGKTLWTNGDEGDKICVRCLGNQNDEARYIAEYINEQISGKGASLKDFAVLYRMNSQSRSIEQTFAKAGIPYRMLGGTRFFERMEVKDIIAYLAIINNPGDDLRLRRIINTPRRGIGEKSVQVAEALAAAEGFTLMEFLRGVKRYNAISPSTANAMVNFVYMMDQFKEMAESLSLTELIEKVIEDTGYAKMLSELPDLTEREDRKANLDELINAARQYEQNNENPSLVEFLEDIALVSDVDKYDENADAVVFMTVHSAKGLEFPVVFLPGMEDNIFPSFQCIMNPEELEEERRLAYVAITRAKRALIVTHVKERMMNGRTSANPLSRFIGEIPKEYTDIHDDAMRSDEVRQRMPRPPKMKPVNHFVEETKRPIPTMKPKPAAVSAGAFSMGDRVKHATFGEGTILSVKPMGADILYEIAFETAGTKKLMATYAKLIKID
ncbi:MAG: ATP-dependent DNA helicase PcrA [Ruminococcaceae bacterium]|nr:ATP-dependent DNA helicase PcrA [Oscillospiraceae bacterium]